MDQGDKQHEATPHRREQARQKGQTPKSQDLASAALLVGALLALMYFGDGIANFFVSYTKLQFETAWLDMDQGGAVANSRSVIYALSHVMLPFLGILLLIAIGVNLAQVGFMFLPEKVAFDTSRINPLKGLGRLVTITNFTRLAFGIFKILVVAGVGLWSLWGERDAIITLGSQSGLQIGTYIVEVTLWTCLKIGVALLILALLDYMFQRWKHEQDIRMTDQEMREEMRSMQGDPHMIARRRAIQRQLVLNRMSTIVPNADVVATNPTELAIAIKYDMASMEAPIVVAKGAGVLAQRIRRMALEHEIPIVERKELARALYKGVEINQPIPAEQYTAVAELLKYVYELKGIEPPTPANAA